MDLNNNLAIEKENIKPEGTNEKVSFENRYEDIVEFDTPAYRPRKKSFGDRSDGRLVKTFPAMSYVSPFIMSVR
jgi:hypothetical protein